MASTTPEEGIAASAPKAASAGLYAGFWRRAAARLVDFLLLVVPSYAVTESPLEGGLDLVVVAVVWWIYLAMLESSRWQATAGKLAFGIKVVDLGGRRISFSRATGRYFASYLSALILFAGFLMAAGVRGQALHDRIAKTLVVDARASDEQVRAGGAKMPLTGGVTAIAAMMVLSVVALLLGIPAYQGYRIRSQFTEVVNELARVSNLVANDIAAQRRAGGAPSPTLKREFESTTKYVRMVTVDYRTGTIFAVIERRAFRNPEIAPNSWVAWTAEFGDGAITGWKCTRERVPAKYLPAACR